MIKVYHNPDSLKLNDPYQDKSIVGKNITQVDFSKLLHVADVETNDLKEAFKSTQNIAGSWTYNKNVKPKVKRQDARSSNMGDVLELDGKMYVITPLGIKELNAEGNIRDNNNVLQESSLMEKRGAQSSVSGLIPDSPQN